MGSPIQDKDRQLDYLKQRLQMFMNLLDAINPEETNLEDIDRLITIIDELEMKCREFQNREA
ncbi:hypothetical protein H1Z61_13055 [Bacillus aquiflavi]|uniref:Uncharacterized protein n=1 Tax=Bacillus aquiflavi TaxID=2672567 RepID=A0A6B3W2V9_9BACI|nr:SE1561 family protein [Bacillus aquiflavi]MBA4538037.1 hypothetical protein [Bacillus aquiflavi]NEY82293.1 hypothetical protein [Bacillus aquiflavi]UAC48800.1 hypothetical protein K6959_02235 [Bacillus aquiflavi]